MGPCAHRPSCARPPNIFAAPFVALRACAPGLAEAARVDTGGPCSRGAGEVDQLVISEDKGCSAASSTAGEKDSRWLIQMQAKENKGGGGADMEKEMNASAWGREEHYLFLKALQQHGDARKTMPANEWLQKIADAVGTRTLDETREHIQEYFQATNHEGLMPASLMSMHEQQYNSQPVQIIHPNAIMECAMPLPIQQPPRLSPACFARIKAQQHTLLGSYCAASEWTREEQIVLEEGLKRFPASQYNNLTRYIKIAAFLPDKTITDVAKRYKWMVELQRLNSINFSDDNDGRQSELPASPSESCTLQHPATGGHFAPNGEKLNPEAAEKLKAKSTTEPEKVLAASVDRPPHTGQETVTSEAGVRRLLNENDSLIKAVKKELGSSAGTGNAKSRLLAKDGGAMEKMIRFRSNLSNVLNCLAMSSGCMSKMPPLLVLVLLITP